LTGDGGKARNCGLSGNNHAFVAGSHLRHVAETLSPRNDPICKLQKPERLPPPPIDLPGENKKRRL
jgi:hypothetical protein